VWSQILTRLDFALSCACPQANAAGLIINTMGWVDGLGYDLLLHSIQALQVILYDCWASTSDTWFQVAISGVSPHGPRQICHRAVQVDKVVVLGDDRLYNQLRSTLADMVRLHVCSVHPDTETAPISIEASTASVVHDMLPECCRANPMCGLSSSASLAALSRGRPSCARCFIELLHLELPQSLNPPKDPDAFCCPRACLPTVHHAPAGSADAAGARVFLWSPWRAQPSRTTAEV
jgi:mRNA cleavage and polyadenylation factor CLP1 P-loop